MKSRVRSDFYIKMRIQQENNRPCREKNLPSEIFHQVKTAHLQKLWCLIAPGHSLFAYIISTPFTWACCSKQVRLYPFVHTKIKIYWAASSEFGTYRLCEQRRFRRAYASAQSRQNLRCSLIQAVSQEAPSDRKPDPWPL